MTELRFMEPAKIGLVESFNQGTNIAGSSESTKLGWMSVGNVIFEDDRIVNAYPFFAPQGGLNTANDKIYSVLPITGASESMVVYNFETTNNLRAVIAGGGDAEITRASGVYTGAYTDIWRSTFLNGVAVLNNGVDDPQEWNPIASTTRLIDLSNWPAATTCKHIVAYKNYLVAVNVTKSGTNYPTMVKWSNAAVPGSAPTTWDETDATEDAGEYPLSGTSGSILDAVVLNDSLIIYKSDAVIRMQWVGGQDVFRFDTISQKHGLHAAGCVKEYIPGKHIMIAKGGYVASHNGQTFTRIGEKKLKNFFKTYWGTYSASDSRGQVAVDAGNQLVYFGYDSGRSGSVNSFLIWNWDLDVWLGYSKGGTTPSFTNLEAGFKTDNSGNVVSGTSVWTANKFVVQELFQLNNPNAIIISEGAFTTDVMAFDSVDRLGRMVSNPSSVKRLTKVKPFFTYGSGTAPTFTITINTTESFGGAVTSTSDLAFDAATDNEVEFLIEGVYYWIEFAATNVDANTAEWKFLGYTLEVEEVGKFL